jgi:prophage regulatory protein
MAGEVVAPKKSREQIAGEKTRTHRPNRLSGLPAKKFDLPETGFVRLKNIIAPYGPIPVSKSTWWVGVRSKRFPQPIKLGPKITAWRVEDIHALIEKLENAVDH